MLYWYQWTFFRSYFKYPTEWPHPFNTVFFLQLLTRGGKALIVFRFSHFLTNLLNNFTWFFFFHRVVANTSPPPDVILSTHFYFWTGEDTCIFQGTSFLVKQLFKYLKFFFTSQVGLFNYNNMQFIIKRNALQNE